MAPLINDDVFDYIIDELSINEEQFSSAAFKGSTTVALHVTATRRTVTFSETAECLEVMALTDYTPEEVNATWYGRDDLRQMKDNSKSDARLFQRGILVEGGDVCSRGLEGKMSDGSRRKRQNRMNAYAAVFFEIDQQQEAGYVDEDAIADAYFNYSEHCQVSANMIAMRDAEDAKNAMQENTTTKLGSSTCFGANLLFSLSTSTTQGYLISSAA